MNNALVAPIVSWAIIVLFQVLILNQIELPRLVQPYIYPLFILLLPFETPIWAVLLAGFGTGFVLDIFSNSPGLHSAATVLLAYIRGIILSRQRPSLDYAEDQQPDLGSMGLYWFLGYATVCMAAHHFCYFLLEIFSLAQLPYILAKTVASCALSVSLIMLSRYLFSQTHQ